MSSFREHRSTVLAGIAIVLAMSGTAYAASTIDGGDIKNGSVTGKDIKDKSLSSKDFNGSVGEQGPQGPQGPAGPAGSARAWAKISDSGVALISQGVATVTHPSVGVYCIALSGSANNSNSVALASPDLSAAATNGGESVMVNSGPTFNDCTPNAQFEVDFFNAADALSDGGFTFMVP